MERKKQLAIFLANAPGAFYRVCQALAEENIKILAMSVSDTIDHAVLRIVVDEYQRAIHLLGEAGLIVLEHDVLLIKMDHSHFDYHHVTQTLSEAQINIEYAYSSSSSGDENFSLVLRTNDLDQAQKVLAKVEKKGTKSSKKSKKEKEEDNSDKGKGKKGKKKKS